MNEQAQNERTQLATVQVSEDERKLVERINMRASARRGTQPKYIHRLLSTPLVFW
jgi:hypothetical protein